MTMMKMSGLMMEMMSTPPMIRVVMKIGALMLVPLQIPFEGEFSASSGASKCRISDLSTRGESI
jgi:hypothetical protein